MLRGSFRASLRASLRASHVLLFAGLGACSDKPYTPFSAASSAVVSAPPVDSVVVPTASAFVGGRGAPPADPSQLVLGEKRFASRELPILHALAAEPASAGEAPAWILAFRGRDGVPEEIVLAHAGSDVLKSVAKIAPQRDAKIDLALVALSPTLVWTTVSARFTDGTSREITQVIRVSTDGSTEVVVSARRDPLAVGESVTLTPRMEETAGEKTLTIDVGLTSMAEPFDAASDVAVPIRFVDKGGALARDAAEPGKSFAARVVEASGKAHAEKTSGAALERLARVARLMTVVCSDTAAPALSLGANDIHCNAAQLTPELLFAMGSAALRAKDPAAALAARVELARGAKSARLAQLDKAIDKEVPRRETIVGQRAKIAGADRGILAPLTFDAEGKLLVITGDTVETWTDTAQDKSDALPWPRSFAVDQHGTALELVGARSTCRFPFVEIRAKSEATEIIAAVPSIAALQPALSGKACAESALPLAPIAVDGDALVVAIGLEVFRVAAKGSGLEVRRAPMPPPGLPASPPGAARAPDGSAYALTRDGALLVGDGKSKPARWSIDTAAQRCVPYKDGARVACVTASDAILLTGKSPPAK